MSYLFNHAGSALWNPSLNVGILFADSVESASRVYHLDSGLLAGSADEAEIDIDIFSRFVESLIEIYVDSQHEVLRIQLPAVVAPGLVMLERAGCKTETVPRELVDMASRLASSMPR